ncbi:hypothetical protein HD806DRAFT_551265 [Xylariaceae sp. AK1471]|nr:hypothetical protein HD806DRAFT_551265 [Xylariaceae sp. AK1471]
MTTQEVQEDGGIEEVSGPQEFTLFQRLPVELRVKIWKMAMEEPRLVHLYARRCGLYDRLVWGDGASTLRRGVPRGSGLKIKNGRYEYQQVPPFFFVNNEARHEALRHYTIRFKVDQMGRGQSSTARLIMSPDDILVSWHHIKMYWDEEDKFKLEFGPQARLVRNIMVHPWSASDFWRDNVWTFHWKEAFNVAEHIIRRLGNEASLEKMFLLSRHGDGPLIYGGRYPGTYYNDSWFEYRKFWLERMAAGQCWRFHKMIAAET